MDTVVLSIKERKLDYPSWFLLFWGYTLNVDFHSRHSLFAGSPGASSALFAPVGVSLGRAFLSGSLEHPLQSTELYFKKKNCRLVSSRTMLKTSFSLWFLRFDETLLTG